ncbi:hypothetical protein RvY_03744 [Ramazzottius varieornatus]|uniref:Uncharacterized protein n=1 Tax=Ramazzottius varieornatus TaxID=947166 RepID=A0A1D1USS9_RAMVA|nr:hypothetical protein RvY_03744 [Ramazzottius varieornatus]
MIYFMRISTFVVLLLVHTCSVQSGDLELPHRNKRAVFPFTFGDTILDIQCSANAVTVCAPNGASSCPIGYTGKANVGACGFATLQLYLTTGNLAGTCCVLDPAAVVTTSAPPASTPNIVIPQIVAYPVYVQYPYGPNQAANSYSYPTDAKPFLLPTYDKPQPPYASAPATYQAPPEYATPAPYAPAPYVLAPSYDYPTPYATPAPYAPPPTYAPAPVYRTPAPTYAPAPVYQTSAPAYQPPAPAPTYYSPAPAPIYHPPAYQPAPAYQPPAYQAPYVAPPYATPALYMAPPLPATYMYAAPRVGLPPSSYMDRSSGITFGSQEELEEFQRASKNL